MKLTEHSIQTALAHDLAQKRHNLIVPNFHVYNYWEADLVSVTDAGYLHEYEIKVDRADLKRELGAIDGSVKQRSVNKHLRHRYMRERFEKSGIVKCANAFWFVLPFRVRDGFELPDYAGIIMVSLTNSKLWPIRFRVERRAPRLHSDKIDDDLRDKLHRGLGFRYWRMRVQAEILARKQEAAA